MEPEICRQRCPLESGESCGPCIQKMIECCYDGPEVADFESIVLNCEGRRACRACCNECASLDCETFEAEGNCPNSDPTLPGNELSRGVTDILACLGDSPLSTAGIAGNADLAVLLDNPDLDPGFAETVFSKIIGCALPETSTVGVTIQGGTVELRGRTGLAPQWEDGPCDVACQEYVTGCFGFSVNFYGLPVIANVSAKVIPFDPMVKELVPVEEGAFFGNMFQVPHRLYACSGRGYDPFYQVIRWCIQDGSPCIPIQYVGPCSDFEGYTLSDAPRWACVGYDEETETYERCHNRLSLPGTDEYPEGTTAYDRVVTIHIKASNFMPDSEPMCFDP